MFVHDRLRLRRIGRAGDVLTEQRNIGLAHLSAIDLAPAALIDLAADTGFGSVTLRLHSAAPGTPVYPLLPGTAELKALAQHARARSVGISEIELVPIDDKLDIDTLAPLFDAGLELGARGVIVTGDIADDVLMERRFAELCDLAGSRNLYVHLEFMRWRAIGTLDQALRVTNSVCRPNARILIDLLHLVRSGGTFAELAALPAGSVDIVQLCDATKELQGDIIAEARGGRLEIGKGALPLADLIGHLPADCSFALEIPMKGLMPERASQLTRSRMECLRILPTTARGRGNSTTA